MPRIVTSFSNATVKRLRSLRDKKARREAGLFLAEGLRIIAEARTSGRLPRSSLFPHKVPSTRSPPRLSLKPRPPAARRSRPRRRSSPRCRARTTRRCCWAHTGSRRPRLPDRPVIGAAVDRHPGAARPGQSRHHPADRRCGRRRRADPGRRQRRSLLGRGGAGMDGGGVHASRGHRALGRVHRLAATVRDSWSGPASRRRLIISTANITRRASS